MLSRVISNSLRISFSFSTTPAVRSNTGSSLLERAGVPAESLGETEAALRQVQEVVQSERKHLSLYANDIHLQLNDRIGINFEQEAKGKTLIFQALPDGSNNSKLAELLVLASAANLWKLLLGFPSYVALGGTLGVAAVSAIWSYSNYLRRSAPQITEVFRTGSGQLEVHYLKPGYFNRGEGILTVDAKNYFQASFDTPLNNYLRKSNRTAWVQVEGKLYWYGNNASVRVNNHQSL